MILLLLFLAMSHQEESQSTPALIHVPESLELTSSLRMIPENNLLESCTRLSVSLEENGLFQVRNSFIYKLFIQINFIISISIIKILT